MSDEELTELINIVLDEYDPEFSHSGDKEEALTWMVAAVKERLRQKEKE